MSPVAWVLNLDAEEELALGRRYTPSDRLRAIVRQQAAALVGELVRPGDLVVEETTAAGAAAGYLGRAWSPTRRARRLLAHAGATLAPAPAGDVLAAVNARPFAVELHAMLAQDAFEKCVASDLDRALELIARPAPLGWLVRRTFGAAGRGRRRLAAGTPAFPDLAWLRAGLARGPLVVEPWVLVTTEFTRSGLVRPDGRVVVSAPCVQRTTRTGAWIDTELTLDVRRTDDARLEEATALAGERLAAAGYFGPFGVDAYRYRDGARERLNPLSEINARYTMDWTRAFDTALLTQ
ncbi:MAG: hypothetical protein WD226_06075 [Planctomycetota bacterium]